MATARLSATKRAVSSLLDDPALPGTGRLSILAATFLFVGSIVAVGGAGVLAGLLFPRLHLTTERIDGRLVIACDVLLSALCFSAGWLLDRRRKIASAPLVALCLVVALAQLFTDVVGVGWLWLAGAGLVVVASVWRHLN